jgi:LysR family transcriptional regulator, pca operon transcriptional activator
VLIPHVLPAFRVSHPRVQVVVIEGYLDAAVPRVAVGEMDFACGTVPFGFARDDLVSEVVLSRNRVMVVAGSDNPLVSRRRVTLSEIQRAAWVLARGGGLRARLNEFFLSRGLPAPEPAFVYEAVTFAKELLRQGPFIGALSRFGVREEIDAGTLRFVRVPDFVLERNVGVIYRSDPALAPAAMRLLDRVRAASALVRRAAGRR